MKKIKEFVFVILLSITIGVIGGLCGAAFSKAVALVTSVRLNNSQLLYLLPIGGLISVAVYKLCRVKNIGTTNVFECVRSEKSLPPLLSFAVFCGTCISHLLGASSGREGAALQIGGGIAYTFSRLLKLDEDTRHRLIMCGMAALFSAVFGTPLAACFFVLEVILTRLCILTLSCLLISSLTSFAVAGLLNVHAERFNMGALPEFSLSLICKILVIVLIGVLVAFIFCKGLDLGKSVAKKLLKNEFLRIAIGGISIVALTLLVGNYDYNGGGIEIIEKVFTGNVKSEAFAIKIIFTIICVSCGYKGGEIIPTLFIGATLGGSLAAVLGLPVEMGGAIGMAVLFVCVTKCPFATILLCCEMFGFYSALLIAPIAIISFCFARYKSLYKNPTDMIYLSLVKKCKLLR